MGYNWPGNVRELMNCITRAVAMAGGTLVHGDDIRFGGEAPSFPDKSDSKRESLEPGNRRAMSYEGEIVSTELNERQRRVFSLFMNKSRISRSDYQDAVGNGFPSRTALYDLHDLVEKGLLRKVGKGPATRYYLAKLPDSAK
jgi:two-component system response regulator HydG